MNVNLTNPTHEENESSASLQTATGQIFATRSAYASIIMLVIVLWLASRSYDGVVLDGIFYMVEALHDLDPSRFANDLYFQFGSQGQFTIYPKLYLPFLPILGVGRTGILFTLLGQALWVSGLILLVRILFSSSTERWLGVVFAIALPASYAFFSYGEGFASARLFSEALTLIALSLFLRQHVIWSFVLLLTAGLIHPLPALPGVAFVFVYLALRQLIWWVVMIGGAAGAFGLALAHVQPFANLLVTYDPEWFSVVKIRDALCFLTEWPVDVYFQQLDTVALAVLAFVFAQPNERRVIVSALIVGVGGIAATFLGADFTRDVLIAGLQPWRAMWLVLAIANLYVGPLLVRFVLSGPANLLKVTFLTAVAVRILSLASGLLVYAAAPLMIVSMLLAIWQVYLGRKIIWPFRLIGLAAMIFSVGTTILFAAAFVDTIPTWSEGIGHFIEELAITVTALALIGLLMRLHHTLWVRQGVLFASGILLFTAAFAWDARSDWTRFVESPEPPPASLTSIIPEDASVYWDGSVSMLWFRWRRTSFFSCDQGTGALFIRPTAIEYGHRRDSFAHLLTIDFTQWVCPGRTGGRAPHYTAPALSTVCKREPGLDYLVLRYAVEGMPGRQWTSPAPVRERFIDDGKTTEINSDRFYIYSCAGIR